MILMLILEKIIFLQCLILKVCFMSYLDFYSSNRYYRFTFCKPDYLLLSKVLHDSLETFRLLKSYCPCDKIDKIIADLNELVWQLETQVERQQFFDSKGV